MREENCVKLCDSLREYKNYFLEAALMFGPKKKAALK